MKKNERKCVTVNNGEEEKYWVRGHEYEKIVHEEFCNLNILDRLGEHERIISLLSELSDCYMKKKSISYLPNLLVNRISHGGYVEIKSSEFFNVIEGVVESNEDFMNLEDNCVKYGVSNISVFSGEMIHEMIRENSHSSMDSIVFLRRGEGEGKGEEEEEERQDKVALREVLLRELLEIGRSIFIVFESEGGEMNRERPLHGKYVEFDLSRSDYKIFVQKVYVDDFIEYFKYESLFFEEEEGKETGQKKKKYVLDYDNLIHLTMIVKNAGESFVEVLRENLKYVDEYTILDTGSTDNTVEIMREVLKGKRGKIYEEPFINFRDSRNRCLDLAGKRCKFLVMLDDTYIIKNDLRTFLETVRGDQFSSSFSMYIHSDDVEYGSNRIIKSSSGLRYKYKIHEVITPENNVNVIIPKNHGYIFDYRSDYMETRTMERKHYDLKILYEMVDEEPWDSRAYYYLGQTYNLLKNYEAAFKNFLLRVNHEDSGFIQEKIDACFEAARLANFYLNKSWEECESLYVRAYEMDKSRPDSLYFIGIHYYLAKNYDKAYDHFKEGFRVGYPTHCQYSLKPTLSFYYLPKFLCEVCYYKGDFELGLAVSQYFLANYSENLKNMKKESLNEEKTLERDHYTVKCWQKIYKEMDSRRLERVSMGEKRRSSSSSSSSSSVEEVKKRLIFVVNGGFTTWKGSDIEKRGMGGSETFIVEISKYIRQMGDYDEVVVFCNCGGNEEREEYKGVSYRPLIEYNAYLEEFEVESVVVSRYPEYLPVLYSHKNVKSVYLILHDLIPEGEIITRDVKLKKIFLLSDYHVNFFNNMFPILSDLTEKFEYGIDVEKFSVNIQKKVKNRFIYSSFANRGLLYLLEMWRDIRKVLDDATLFVHCDVENAWLNEVCKDDMRQIKSLLYDLRDEGIVYKGWTSKEELSESWGEASVWFYPTTFLETFCLTALEAAVSRTLAVSFPIGSLVETIGDRGLLINRNVLSVEGREMVLGELFSLLLGESRRREEMIERNYSWGKKKTWEERGKAFMSILG